MKTILLSIFAVATFSNAILAQTFKYSFETSDGFTVGDLSGQNPNILTFNYGNGDDFNVAFVNTNLASNGTQSVKLPDGETEIVFNNVPIHNKTTVSCDLYIPAGGPGGIEFIIDNKFSIGFYEGNVMAYFWSETTPPPTISTYVTEMWYHIEVIKDYSSHTIEVLINGASYYTNAMPGNPPANSFLNFQTYATGSEFYFDNIEVKDSSATLGVSDANAKSKLTVYPNPTSDFINIKSDKKISQITFVDLSGKMVKQTKENLVDVQSLAQGIYIANIKFEDGSSESKKIIKK